MLLSLQRVEGKPTQVCQRDRRSTPLCHSVSRNVELVLHLFASAFDLVSLRRVQSVVVLGLPSCQVGLVGLAFPS